MADEETELFRSNAPQERVKAEQSAPNTRQPAKATSSETRALQDSTLTAKASPQQLAEVHITQHGPDALGQFPISHNNTDDGTPPIAGSATAEIVAPLTPALVMPEIKKEEEEEAVPWAISIDLEKRIQSLSTTTAAVNRELDALEASSRKLAIRMKS